MSSIFHRVDRSARSPAGRRGTSMLEVVIAAVLALILVGAGIQFWTQGTRWFGKGDDAQVSLQESSMIMARLRHDLSAMGLDPNRQADMMYACTDGSIRGAKRVMFDLTGRALQVTEGSGADASGASLVLTFYIQRPSSPLPAKVTWRYFKNQARLERTLSGEEPRSYAVPRLKEFTIDLQFWSSGADAAPFRSAFEPVTSGRCPVNELWFRIAFTVQGDRKELHVEATRVALESRIFPKQLNRRFVSRWSPTS